MTSFRLLIGICIGAFSAMAVSADSVDVNSTVITLSQESPEATTAGRLSFRGGLVLSSLDPRFGGFSGLGVSANGARMLSVSDRGVAFSANLTYDERGYLSGISDSDLGSLSDFDGTPLAGKRFTDAEAMSPGVGGEIIVAFERQHRIWRYDPGATIPQPIRPPDELESLPSNDGIEALTLLNDGRLLAIAEGSAREAASIAWTSKRKGWEVLTYIAGDGYRPTGAATLPSGDVLVLERYYTPRAGVRVRLKLISADAVRAGSEVRGEELATLAPPMNVDNFEGIEVRRSGAGETLIYLISDDNFSADQRTLLMMFALEKS